MPLKQRNNNNKDFAKFKKDNNRKMFDYDKENIRKNRKQKMSLYETNDYAMADDIIPQFNFDDYEKEEFDKFNKPTLVFNIKYIIYFIYDNENYFIEVNTSFVNLLSLLPELNRLNPEGRYRLDL